jgi:hypothetical protein
MLRYAGGTSDPTSPARWFTSSLKTVRKYTYCSCNGSANQR